MIATMVSSSLPVLISCERGMGRLRPDACGRRWAIAHGLVTASNSKEREFFIQVTDSPCRTCIHGKDRVTKESSGAVPRSARQKRTFGRTGCIKCGDEFERASPAQKTCARCKTTDSSREPMNASTNHGTIICERGYGSMSSSSCGKRWGIARGLPVIHKNTPIEVSSIKKSKCARCTYGEKRLLSSDMEPPPSFRIGERPAPVVLPPPRVEVSRSDEAAPDPAPASVPRCSCGAAIVRKTGQVGRLPSRCDSCREHKVRKVSARERSEQALDELFPHRPSERTAPAAAPLVDPTKRPARPLTCLNDDHPFEWDGQGKMPMLCPTCLEESRAQAHRIREENAVVAARSTESSSLVKRIAPVLEGIKNDVSRLEAELQQAKRDANTLACTAGLESPYPEVA